MGRRRRDEDRREATAIDIVTGAGSRRRAPRTRRFLRRSGEVVVEFIVELLIDIV
jgi:hypothetical protein